jgi:hypothetical protein
MSTFREDLPAVIGITAAMPVSTALARASQAGQQDAESARRSQ